MQKLLMKFNLPALHLLPHPNYSFVRWCGGLFFTFGLLALSYVGYVWLDTKRYQAEQGQRFADALKETPLKQNLSVSADAPLGRLEISRLGLTVMVQEGVDAETLRRAVGHIPGTSLPGQHGNIALAGHRDTFFRELRHLRQGDEITLTTLTEAFHYRVETLKIVEPYETQVLIDVGYDKVTLVTCYPFNFVGSAPQRFIVSARKIPK